MRFKLIIYSCIFMIGSLCNAEKLTLANSGKTNYAIITAENIGMMEKFAVDEFKKVLHESTGVTFKVVSAENAAKYPYKIVLGKNSESYKLLGKSLIDNLKPEEALVVTKGQNLILVGGGKRGTVYAVYDFLENQLGCSWFSAYGDSYIPKIKKLQISSVNHSSIPAFKYRHLTTYFYPRGEKCSVFFYRNRLNMNELQKANGQNPEWQNKMPSIYPNVHTLFFYMNPNEKYHPGWVNYPKPSQKDFFKKHPEYYSLDRNGRRSRTLQLCFSNPELRKVLTRQIEDVIKKTGYKRGVLTLDANDVPGHFCYCPKCKALAKRYGTIAGPLLDYLIEFCSYLKKNHPGIYVKTLAYRKKQSEVPPKGIRKLPDNLIVVFAPIDDNFATTLAHSSNKDTLNNLKRWCEITKNVWLWYYTNPYCSDNPPFGNIKRMVKDIKIMRKAGVNGTFFEHDAGVPTGLNFSELQTWLLLKLFQDPNQKTIPLIQKFTDFYYGKAALIMRKYIRNLEKKRKELKISLPWNPSFSMFAYLTPSNIIKWEKMFDQMEKLTSANKQHLFHVKLARITLDIAALNKIREIKLINPGFKPDITGLEKRIRSTYHEMLEQRMPTKVAYYEKGLDKLLAPKLLLAKANLKPLPAPFNRIAKSKLRQAFPVRNTRKDPAAALGIALAEQRLELPFSFGFYDSYNRKFITSRKIAKNEIIPDKYHLYKLGRVKLTPQCLVWCSGSWKISIPLEQFYVMGYPNIEWDIYASLKFEGKGYSSKSKFNTNKVLCDRIVLVRASK